MWPVPCNARDRYVRHAAKRAIAERSLVHIVNDKNAIACSSRSFCCANVTTWIIPAIREIHAAVSCTGNFRVQKNSQGEIHRSRIKFVRGAAPKFRFRRTRTLKYPIACNLRTIGTSILYAEKDCFSEHAEGSNPLEFNSNFSKRENLINVAISHNMYGEIK